MKTILKMIIPSALMDSWRTHMKNSQEIKCRKLFYEELLCNTKNQNQKTIFDIGANRGNRIDAFIQLGAKTIAVEPQKSCIEYLHKKYKNENDVIIIPKAAGKSEGQLVLRTSGDRDVLASTSLEFMEKTKSSGRFVNAKWDQEETVGAITLDLLIQEYGLPDFIKIDVEGAELDVLLGLNHKVKCLSFEFTPELPTKMKQCVNRCAELGMTSFNISFGESMKLSFQQWLDVNAIQRLIYALEGNNYLFGDIYAKS